MSLITLIFTIQQFIVLFQRKGTTFTSTDVLGHYESDFTFDYEDGLAFAVSLYDSEADDYVDTLGRPLYEFAELKATLITSGGEYEEFSPHPCTEEDLDKFYPLTESQSRFEQAT